MNSERPDESTIFHFARGIVDDEERRAYLAKACGSDAELRGRVEKLLAAYAEDSRFLERPPPELAATQLIGPPRDNLAASLEAGLASAFTEDQALVLGNSEHSVLRSLDESIHVSRLELREPEVEGSDPLTRPQSPEMPRSTSATRYQFQGEIARGGMGAIIKGRDIDLGRDLAIKVLLDQHKDKPEMIRRFVEEAQIGGQLQHPGIAPVYDLGQFADKRPFFSMKLVKGQTLSKLLTEREIPADDRGRFLGIFEQICQTVAYAHARGVIHRDLKPANIMVGAFGEVQVMDWGLAKVLPAGGVADEKKALDQHHSKSIVRTLRSVGSDTPGELCSVGSQTQIGSVMGTPAYMPPEQALGEIDNLDERADVFGLGAILCEILTGKPPYVAEDAMQVYRLACRGKLAECLTRLDASGADQDLIALTKDCLEVEPAARPRNAGSLAERMTRYLETVEKRLREAELQRAAEAARADAQSAQAAAERQRAEAESSRAQAESARAAEQRKRLQITLVLSMSILLVLTAGILGTTYQANEAEKARFAESKRAASERSARQLAENAQQQAERAAAKEIAANEQAQKRLTQVEKGNEIITSIFHDLDIRKIKAGSEPVEAVLAQRLVTAADQIADQSIGDPLVVAQLQKRLGDSLLSLGYPNEAAELLKTALKTHEALRGDDDRITLNNRNKLALAFQIAGKFETAIPLFEETVTLMKTKLGADDADTIGSMGNLAQAYREAGQLNLSLPLFEETLKLQNALANADHGKLILVGNFASAYRAAGKLDLALPLMEENLEIAKSLLGIDHPDTLASMQNLATVYLDQQKLDLALPLLEESLKLRKLKQGSEHLETLGGMNNLALAYRFSGQFDRAIRLSEETVALMKDVLGIMHPKTLVSMSNLASAYHAAGKLGLALPLFEETWQRQKEKLGADHSETLTTMHNLALAYEQAGKKEKGRRLLEETLQLMRKKLGVEHRETLHCMSNLARIYQTSGQPDLAIALYLETVSLMKIHLGGEHAETLFTMSNLANTYWDTGKWNLALPHYEESLRLRRMTLGNDHLDTVYSIHTLGTAYKAFGKFDLALPLLEEALSFRKSKLGIENLDTINTMTHLAVAYWQTRQLDKSIPLFEECLRLREKLLGRRHVETITTVANLGVNYKDAGRLADAIPLLEEAYEESKKQPELRWVAAQLLDGYDRSGMPEKTMMLAKQQLVLARQTLPTASPELAAQLALYGRIMLQMKNHAEAEPVIRECLSIREKIAPDDWSLFNAQSMLGGSLLGQKKFAEAEPLLLASYEGLKQREQMIPGGALPRLIEALERLIEYYMVTDKPDDVKKWQNELENRKQEAQIPQKNRS